MLNDLLIKNGLIVDGTGNTAYKGCVGIIGENIAYVGTDEQPAKAAYDADGAAVCPGFIDIHTHADMGILLCPSAENYVRQGVSSVVTGNCGMSLAPSNDFYVGELQAYIASFVPDEIKKIWRWNTFAEFLDSVDAVSPAVNIIPLVGHGTIRIACEGFKKSPAAGERFAAMETLLEACLDQGAWGMSTGLIYPPGSYSDADELARFCEILGRRGAVYTTHLRSEGTLLVESVEEAIAFCEKYGVPLQLSHHKAASPKVWGLVNKTLEMMRAARNRGVDARCDVYPYDRGCTTITALLPNHALEGGIGALLNLLRNPSSSRALADYIAAGGGENEEISIRDLNWSDITIISCPAMPECETKTIDEIVPSGGKMERLACFLDWMLAVKATGMMVLRSMSMADVDVVVTDHDSIIASDSWISDPSTPEMCHPRNFGTFPQFIRRYVCEHRALSIEDAVRKITSEPARRIGLSDRGIIARGKKADILVFRPEEIDNLPTFDEPKKFAKGFHQLWINGKSVLEGDSLSGNRPGRVLRRV
ncbi:MAG: D-aminoacylase [Synergistaceae bacterium]|jgi:N-acyl-D-amino-acid deacylase|nr:D-aminoacylase [Synergistaceae bacterium]